MIPIDSPSRNLWTRLAVSGTPDRLLEFHAEACGRLDLAEKSDTTTGRTVYWVEVGKVRRTIRLAGEYGLTAGEVPPEGGWES